jgi:hypothetical protein
MPNFEKMISLVGENPLPVYLGIRQLTADGARILLVHSSGSPGTKEQADRVKARLERDAGSRLVSLFQIADPWDPASVLSAVAGLPGSWGEAAFDYTGGTKVMSAMAVRAAADRFAALVYLEEARGQFRIWSPASGETESRTLSALDPPLGVRDLCDLHNITVHPDATWQPDPTPADLLAIWHRRLAEHRADTDRILEFPTNEEGNQGSDAAWRIYQRNQGRLGPCLDLLTPETRSRWAAIEAPSTPAAYSDSQRRAVFEFFASRQWFEYLMRELVLSVSQSTDRIAFGTRPDDPVLGESDILSGQEFLVGQVARPRRRDPRMFEADVLGVVDNRLRYLSVTTGLSRKSCKAKMFEAVHRSRQIGGGLASSCVVSLADSGGVADCRTSVGLHPRHTIYGLSDVERWFQGNAHDLRRFLTQDFR